MKEIKFNNRPNKSYKIKDKLVWESRSPALVAVIIANMPTGKYVLVGKRGPGSADNHGRWNCICGYLDWDENAYDGICREIYEESGLYIPDVITDFYIVDNHMEQPFFVNTDPKENKQNISLSYGLWFNCDELPKLSIDNCEPGEVSEAKWLKMSDIDSYDFAFEHDKRIRSYEKIVNSIYV